MTQKDYNIKNGETTVKVTIASYKPLENAEDKEFFRTNLQAVWDLLQEAYRGEFKGCASRSDFKKKCSELKIATYNGETVAVSVYNNYAGGNKCVGLGATRKTDELHEIGRQAIIRIIGDDFNMPEKWYWIEASGKIEKICDDSKAIPIPAELVPQIVVKREFTIVDKYHYRMVLGSGIKVKKKMFGVKDRETFEILKKYYTDRNEHLEWILSDPTAFEGKTYEFKNFHTQEELVKSALDYFIILYVEEELRELPPGMMAKFDEYIEKMRVIVKTQKKHPNARNFLICLQDAVKCRKRMTTFEVHRAE